jgi:hypothetical protein
MRAGIILASIIVIGFFGEAIGSHYGSLMVYLVIAMGASYALPIIMSIYTRKLFWLIVIPLITTFALAFPSSFVYNAGCKAGYGEATWAMRAIPPVWIIESVAGEKAIDLAGDCKRLETFP